MNNTTIILNSVYMCITINVCQGKRRFIYCVYYTLLFIFILINSIKKSFQCIFV